jgi:orotate phosphoribosyltransferase
MTALEAAALTDNATDSRLDFIEEQIRRRSVITADRQRIVSKAGRDQTWLVDLRPVLLDARALRYIAELFWERFADKLPFQIGGLETAAIPLVSAIAIEGDRRGHRINAFFVRKGTQGQWTGPSNRRLRDR